MEQTIEEIINSKEYKQEEEKRWNKEILLKFELPKAIQILCKALKEDEDYYRSWKDNIAITFKDEYSGTLDCGKDFIHQISNNAADNFLKLLISQ